MAPAAGAGRGPAPRVLQPWERNVALRVWVRNPGAVGAVSVSPKKKDLFFFFNNSFASVSAAMMLVFAANTKLQKCCYKTALNAKTYVYLYSAAVS